MNSTTESKPETKKDVYSIANEIVTEHLKRGVVPWLVPWTKGGVPQNLINHIEFRGINVFLLAALGYKKNFFITPKQLEKAEGTVKKNEKGYPVFYWKWDDENGNKEKQTEKKSPALRYYYVYNIEQCDGIKKSMIPEIHVPENPLQMCQALVASMPNPPAIAHGPHPAS